MTISLARTNSTEVKTTRTRSVIPADVWDLERRSVNAHETAHVRTLDARNRTCASVDIGGSNGRPESDGVFESRREKGGATIMGALFGIALIVGSAFGGAFSGGDAGFVPHETSQHMAAVVQ